MQFKLIEKVNIIPAFRTEDGRIVDQHGVPLAGQVGGPAQIKKELGNGQDPSFQDDPDGNGNKNEVDGINPEFEDVPAGGDDSGDDDGFYGGESGGSGNNSNDDAPPDGSFPAGGSGGGGGGGGTPVDPILFHDDASGIDYIKVRGKWINIDEFVM